MAERPDAMRSSSVLRSPPSDHAPSSGEKAQIEPSWKLVCRGPIHLVSAAMVQKPQARGPGPERYGRAIRNVASRAKPEMIGLLARSHIPSSSGKAWNGGIRLGKACHLG